MLVKIAAVALHLGVALQHFHRRGDDSDGGQIWQLGHCTGKNDSAKRSPDGKRFASLLLAESLVEVVCSRDEVLIRRRIAQLARLQFQWLAVRVASTGPESNHDDREASLIESIREIAYPDRIFAGTEPRRLEHNWAGSVRTKVAFKAETDRAAVLEFELLVKVILLNSSQQSDELVSNSDLERGCVTAETALAGEPGRAECHVFDHVQTSH